MVVIMQEHQEREQHDVSHNSFHSSFSRIGSEELNDMGYGLSRISPITFNDDAFQTLSNRAKDRALTLTPRKKRNEANTESNPTTQTPQQDGNAKLYNADLSVAGTSSNKPSSRFVPPQPNNTDSSSQEMDNSKQVYQYTNVTQECRIYRNYRCYPNHKSKGFTGWWNPIHATTIPQEVYINRRDTNISPKR